jgi:hypothetical protein
VAYTDVNDPAADVTLYREGEAPVRLSELWKQGPLLALFLRHFG